VLTERRIRRHHHLGMPGPAACMHGFHGGAGFSKEGGLMANAGRTTAMVIVRTWPPYLFKAADNLTTVSSQP
jgi:hypothetical protein